MKGRYTVYQLMLASAFLFPISIKCLMFSRSILDQLQRNVFAWSHSWWQALGSFSLQAPVGPPRISTFYKALPWLRHVVAGLLPGKTVWGPRRVNVEFLMDTVTVEQVFLRVLPFSFVSTSINATYSQFIPLPPKVCNITNWQHP